MLANLRSLCLQNFRKATSTAQSLLRSVGYEAIWFVYREVGWGHLSPQLYSPCSADSWSVGFLLVVFNPCGSDCIMWVHLQPTYQCTPKSWICCWMTANHLVKDIGDGLTSVSVQKLPVLLAKALRWFAQRFGLISPNLGYRYPLLLCPVLRLFSGFAFLLDQALDRSVYRHS